MVLPCVPNWGHLQSFLSKIANCSMQSVKSPLLSVVKRTKAQKIIAELVIKQNSSDPSSRKKFGCMTLRPYDRTTAQGATFNMRGQLYRGHAQWCSGQCTGLRVGRPGF